MVERRIEQEDTRFFRPQLAAQAGKTGAGRGQDVLHHPFRNTERASRRRRAQARIGAVTGNMAADSGQASGADRPGVFFAGLARFQGRKTAADQPGQVARGAGDQVVVRVGFGVKQTGIVLEQTHGRLVEADHAAGEIFGRQAPVLGQVAWQGNAQQAHARVTLNVEAGIVDADRAEAGRQFIVAAELAATDGRATVVQLDEQRIVAVLLDMTSPAVAGNGKFLEITDDDFRPGPQGHRGLTAGFDIAATHDAQIADNTMQPIVDDAFAAAQVAVRAKVFRRKADPVKHYVIMPAFAYSATALRHCHCRPPFLPPAWKPVLTREL